jgi:putative CocE/NonD family hydrolase
VRLTSFIFSSLTLCGLLSSDQAQTGSAPYKASDHYSKIEYMIPMRDGVKLYCAVYVPKDVPGEHPILMERTPYSAGPYGPTSFTRMRGSHLLKDKGYIFAFSDVRGHYYSEGDYMNIRPELHPGQKGIDESTDTYDTVDYLVKNVPSNNKAVGLWGISYPGFYAGVGAIHTHPNLKAVSPQAPVSNWFLGDDFHHNGVFFLQDAFEFLGFFGPVRKGPGPSLGEAPRFDRGTTDPYKFYLKTGTLPNFDANYYKGAIPFWKDMMNHPNYDQWWKDRSLPDHMKDVHCAVLTVGGWFDAEDMWGALNTSKQTTKQNPGTPSFLVMGPWYHGMWASPNGTTFGDLDFGQNTSTWYQDNVEFPFFEKYLRGQDVPAPAKATLFETGANKWQTFDIWPPKDLGKANFYIGANGSLTSSKPVTKGADSYVNDPSDPTPYLAKPETPRRTREYMIDDQRWAEKRSDVLTYKAQPVTADLRVAGGIDVNLWVSTTGTDADFVVKVIDVWPADSKDVSSKGVSMAGYEQELRADIFRGKFRNSYSKPEPFVPGAPTLVHFHLNDLLHTFKTGHSVMLQVQSNWFPLADRNPNVFENINEAKDSDFQKATITLYRDPSHPTHITFGTIVNP